MADNKHWAHTKKNKEPHSLDSHLLKTAEIAAQFSGRFGSQEWGYLAGLWHDLGKYHEKFQTYIGNNPEDENAHIEPIEGKAGKGSDHSTAGALYALQAFRKNEALGEKKGRILAHLIAAHHTGLLDWQSTEITGASPLANRLDCPERKKLFDDLPWKDIPNTILDASVPKQQPSIDAAFGASLWIRMLFSCLVDADFLDTESYMDGDKHALRKHLYQSLAEMKSAFDVYMEGKAANAQATDVNRLRADVLQQCRTKALDSPGLFSLTVPTGGGKTLSSLAFALDHAVQHHKKRIIYVIPYTSIIEQTADVFRGVFPAEQFPDHVIEHHSSLDPEDDKKQNSRTRLAAENWEAPLIVTTSVQFLESLFAARTSRVRKLHNIANSVVIFDEAQLLPPEFLQPILRAIEELKQIYGVTVVFATATQPALTVENTSLKQYGLKDVQEIIEDPQELSSNPVFIRTKVILPQDFTKIRTWPEIAEDLRNLPQALCIVNRRDDARELYLLLKETDKEGLFHLSALMCPAHRRQIIATIKDRLVKEQPVCVVSTQLVESGVDIDFPIVYRALSGLDSIVQAAGRCNREGKLGYQGGRVHLFVSAGLPHSTVLKDAYTETLAILQDTQDTKLLLSPDTLKDFFTRYYRSISRRKGGHDIKDIMAELDCRSEELDKQGQDVADWKCNFRTVANRFNLIDSSQLPIVVPHHEGKKLIDELKNNNFEKLNRKTLRALQPYTVSVYRYEFEQLQREGKIVSLLTKDAEIYTVAASNQYKIDIGFDKKELPFFSDYQGSDQ